MAIATACRKHRYNAEKTMKLALSTREVFEYINYPFNWIQINSIRTVLDTSDPIPICRPYIYTWHLIPDTPLPSPHHHAVYIGLPYLPTLPAHRHDIDHRPTNLNLTTPSAHSSLSPHSSPPTSPLSLQSPDSIFRHLRCCRDQQEMV